MVLAYGFVWAIAALVDLVRYLQRRWKNEPQMRETASLSASIGANVIIAVMLKALPITVGVLLALAIWHFI